MCECSHKYRVSQCVIHDAPRAVAGSTAAIKYIALDVHRVLIATSGEAWMKSHVTECSSADVHPRLRYAQNRIYRPSRSRCASHTFSR